MSKDKKEKTNRGTGFIKTEKSITTMRYEVKAERNISTLNSGKFKKACEIAGIPVTMRQASKWNHSKGSAFAHRFKA